MSEKKSSFTIGIERLRELGKKAANMSDMKNWAIVHATRYLPQQTKDGHLTIPTTAMVSDFKIPRATIHTTLNHVVTAHGAGSWDNVPYVIVAPYSDTVEQNGNPDQVSLYDTYFIPNPDTGLVLPQSAHIIMPSSEMQPGELIRTDGNRTYYNSNVDKFSEEQINLLVSSLSKVEQEEYAQWASGEFEEWDIPFILKEMGEAAQKMYEQATDKKAFLRGAFAEARYDMLTYALRNLAVTATLGDMGYDIVKSNKEEIAYTIADTAFDAGVRCDASNKGHSNSLSSAIEDHWGAYEVIFNKSIISDGLFNMSGDWDAMFELLSNDTPAIKSIRDSLINNKPIDFAKEYADEYKDFRDRIMPNVAEGDTVNFVPETIDGYSKHLATTVQRNSVQMSKKFEQWRAQTSKMPGYDEFIVRLKQLHARDIARANMAQRFNQNY